MLAQEISKRKNFDFGDALGAKRVHALLWVEPAGACPLPSLIRGSVTVRKIGGFDETAYRKRLRLLREIVTGGSQQEFADKLGIPMKRWNNYERGYPLSRETAFLLMRKFPGVSVEWLWFGMTGNLAASFAAKVKAAEKFERERELARASLKKAKDRVRLIEQERAKDIYPEER